MKTLNIFVQPWRQYLPFFQKPSWTLLSHRWCEEHPQSSQVQFWTQSCLSLTSHLSSPHHLSPASHRWSSGLSCALLSLESAQSHSSCRRIWAQTQLPPLHELCIRAAILVSHRGQHPKRAMWSSLHEQEKGFLRHLPCQESAGSNDDILCSFGNF